jgi:hypothetical protein
MVLAAGPALIEDVRKAPDDVLSFIEPSDEVCWRAKRKAHTHEDYLVPSTTIHTRLIEPEGRLRYGRNPFQINPGCCNYFQAGPRRVRHGYG